MMHVAEAQREGSYVADVEIVALAIAEPVVGELRVLDEDIARLVGVGEDAVLVVVKITVAHGQAEALEPDARAILVLHLRAGKLHALDRGVVALDDPDRLAFSVGAVGAQVSAPADTTDREPMLPPDRSVAVVDSGVDLDDVSIAGDLRSSTRALEFPRRADAQHRRLLPFAHRLPRVGGGVLARWREQYRQCNRKHADRCSRCHLANCTQ